MNYSGKLSRRILLPASSVAAIIFFFTSPLRTDAGSFLSMAKNAAARTYSAPFFTPEPTAISLVGIGLVAAAKFGRKGRRD